MITMIFAFIFFVAASALLFLSAKSDWRGLVIPNEYSIALLGIYLLGGIIPNILFPGVNLLSGFLSGLIVFAITIVLYAGNAMGGGDTKLAGAVATLVGLTHVGLFLLVMTLTGGALGLYALLTRKHGDKLLPANPTEGSWLAQLKAGQNKVPYGIAIAAGGIVALANKWLSPLSTVTY